MNWLFIFCDPNILENGNGRVVECACFQSLFPRFSMVDAAWCVYVPRWNSASFCSLRFAPSGAGSSSPKSYCFTSAETNWSNNPVLFPRTWFNKKMRALAFKDWERNNMFEFNVMMDWLTWKPPAIVCVSLEGFFRHHEIDQ